MTNSRLNANLQTREQIRMREGYTITQNGKSTSERKPLKVEIIGGALGGQFQTPAKPSSHFWPELIRGGGYPCYELSQYGHKGHSAKSQVQATSENQVDTHPAATILVVEDEMIVALDLQHALERMGYTVVGVACSGREAIQQASISCPDVILMDIHLKGDMDGVEAAKQIGIHLKTAIIYLTAQADECTLQRVQEVGPTDILFKPFSQVALQATIEEALSLADV